MEPIIDESNFPLQNYGWVSRDTAGGHTKTQVKFYDYRLQSREVNGPGVEGPVMRTYEDPTVRLHKNKSGSGDLQGIFPRFGEEDLALEGSPGRPQDPDRPLSLRVIDFPRCSYGKSFVQEVVRENDWGPGVMEMVPLDLDNGNLGTTFCAGISLPRNPGGTGTRPDSPVLVFTVSLHYLGYYHVRGGNQTLSESLSLFRYCFRREDPRGDRGNSGKEVIVHQTWFMFFNNDLIAMFRSVEDGGPYQPPLYPCQDRVCAFKVLVHMISNTLAFSQKEFFIALNNEVSEMGFQVICRIGSKPEEGEKDKEMIRGLEAIIADIRGSMRVVESQVNVLEDLQRLYWNIRSSIQPTEEQISPALEMIREEIKERNTFYRKLDILLATVKNSKEDLLGKLAEELVASKAEAEELAASQAKELAESRAEAAKDTVKEQTDAIKAQTTANQAAVEAQTAANQAAIKLQTKETLAAMGSQRQIMSMLTILTTVFLPLGFFTSLFGMTGEAAKSTSNFYRGGGLFWGVCGGVTAVISLITLFVVLRSRNREWYKALYWTPKGLVKASRGEPLFAW